MNLQKNPTPGTVLYILRALCARTRDTLHRTTILDGAGAGSSPGEGLTMGYYGDSGSGSSDCSHIECMSEDECKYKDEDDDRGMMGGML